VSRNPNEEGTMKLKLDDIRVDSFATGADAKPARGTVRGHEASLIVLTCYISCPPQYSCPECPPPA
jgi:hypothetical protein